MEKIKEKKWRNKTKRRIILIILGMLLCFISICFYQNMVVEVTEYRISSDKISDEFVGFRILQISDLHSIRTERRLSYLVGRIEAQEADIIVITGDLIDSRYYREKDEDGEAGIPDAMTLAFLAELVKIAPVFYVYGNHEMILLDDVENNPFKNAVIDSGVYLMNNARMKLTRGQSFLYLLGVQDPATVYKDRTFADKGDNDETLAAMLEYVTQDMEEEHFTLLLSHRPEQFDLYQQYDIDLVLSGHAHGGVIRLPFLGGVYASSQGFFPEYDSGVYEDAGTSMVVSRGIGNSKIPFRVFNTPELVMITLVKE